MTVDGLSCVKSLSDRRWNFDTASSDNHSRRIIEQRVRTRPTEQFLTVPV